VISGPYGSFCKIEHMGKQILSPHSRAFIVGSSDHETVAKEMVEELRREQKLTKYLWVHDSDDGSMRMCLELKDALIFSIKPQRIAIADVCWIEMMLLIVGPSRPHRVSQQCVCEAHCLQRI